jgi:hypothetical protein
MEALQNYKEFCVSSMPTTAKHLCFVADHKTFFLNTENILTLTVI